MPFLIIGRERYALPIGDTRIGGAGDDTFVAPELASLPLAAIISVTAENEATFRAAGDVKIRVNDQPVGSTPLVLTHGTRIDIGNHRLLFGHLRETGSTVTLAPVNVDELALLAGLTTRTPTADTGGRLVSRADDRTTAIPPAGMRIGRDPGCDLVLSGKSVSREHASIRPSLQGYAIVDASENGTWVNGRRVDGAELLGMGDVIRIGDVEFRFEADAATYQESPAPAPVNSPAAVARQSDLPASQPGAAMLLATLEVLAEGLMKGRRFRIERPVAHIGRGAHNDVRLEDSGVSTSHATLTRRGRGWVLLDLGSTNGTYVDGERIHGERAIVGVAELRCGTIKLLFRPIAGGGQDDTSTRVLVRVPDEV